MHAMKRQNNNSTVSKLGESAYNALMMPRQWSGDEKRILHYSYNLASTEGEDAYSSSIDSEGYQELRRTDAILRPERKRRALTDEYVFDKGLRRGYSTTSPSRHSFDGGESKWGHSLASRMLYSDGSAEEHAQKQSKEEFWRTVTQNSQTRDNGASEEPPSRKIGVGETTNMSLMGHKLRKKAVCDSTDNSHYQRQFLRVLNKRF